MKTIKKTKKFDAIKMMRTIRERISSETHHMTFDQLKIYINNELLKRKSGISGKK